MSAPRERTFVLDTNVAIHAFLPDDLVPDNLRAVRDAGRRFIARAVEVAASLIVPHRFYSEAIAAMQPLIYQERLSVQEAKAVLASVFALRPRTRRPDWNDVVDITVAMGRSSTGDSEFVAVARAEHCEVVTSDRPFWDAVRQRKIPVPVVLVTDHRLAQP